MKRSSFGKSGESRTDLKDEVFSVTVCVGDSLDHFDLVVDVLQAVPSVPGIVHAVIERRQEVGLPIFGDPTSDTFCTEVIPKILDSAQSGDRLTRTVFFESGAFLGEAVAKLISLYDPESLLITGAGVLFEDSMRRTLIQRSITAIYPNLSVTFGDHESHHEAAGAALLAMEHRLRRRA